jgi:hypothetical protein
MVSFDTKKLRVKTDADAGDVECGRKSGIVVIAAIGDEYQKWSMEMIMSKPAMPVLFTGKANPRKRSWRCGHRSAPPSNRLSGRP